MGLNIRAILLIGCVVILLLLGVMSHAQNLERETNSYDGSRYCRYEDGYVYHAPGECAPTRDQVVLPKGPWLTSERVSSSGRRTCSYSDLTTQHIRGESCPSKPEARWNHVFTNGPWLSSQISTGALTAPAIYIHCQSETGNWYLSFEARGYVTSTTDPVDVNVKFDKGQRVPTKWLPTDTKSVKPPDSGVVFQRILQHRTLELGIADYRNRWEYVKYNLGGLPPRRVVDACDLSQ